MNNMEDYIKSENQKYNINQIIRNTCPNIDDHEKVTNLVYDKIAYIEELKNILRQNSIEHIKDNLKKEGNELLKPEQIIESLIYFSLIVENVWLTEEIEKLKSD